jgi:CRISPR/Cas system-associated protein Cas5 (RAMP superfamily)
MKFSCAHRIHAFHHGEPEKKIWYIVLFQKKYVETISTGNCKVYQNEADEEKYKYYLELREKVYEFHKKTDKNII